MNNDKFYKQKHLKFLTIWLVISCNFDNNDLKKRYNFNFILIDNF